MKANLEPRAKIGDVVIVKKRKDSGHPEVDFELEQLQVKGAHYLKFKKDSDGDYWAYETESEDTFFNEDILKNLTTNVSYE